MLISDNCTPDSLLIVTSSDSHSGSCPVVVTRTYRVTDACGNYSEVTQTINVSDTIACHHRHSCRHDCYRLLLGDAPAAVATVSALESLGVLISDNCTPDSLLIVTSSDSHSGSCPVVVTRTYRVTDACGNYSEVTQTINISTLSSLSSPDSCEAVKVALVMLLLLLPLFLHLSLWVCWSQTTVLLTAYLLLPAVTVTLAVVLLLSRGPIVSLMPVVTTVRLPRQSTFRHYQACHHGILADTTVTGCTAGDAPAAVTTVSALESLGVLVSDNCTPDSLLIVTSSDSPLAVVLLLSLGPIVSLMPVVTTVRLPRQSTFQTLSSLSSPVFLLTRLLQVALLVMLLLLLPLFLHLSLWVC
ncbi:MAG: hypothetical protein IPI74_02485 [Bacteroidales bacterium]|nr:hypothetical protein [Bacteroidales bacterium]